MELRATAAVGRHRLGPESGEGLLLLGPPPAVRVQAASARAARLLGHDGGSAVGLSLDELAPGLSARLEPLVREAIASGGARARFRRPHETGEIEVHCAALLADGNPAHVKAIAIRVVPCPAPETPEGEMARLRGESEALHEDFQRFAYAASHDLREPVRMITSYLRLIERRYGDRLDADGREFIGFATDGAARLNAMLDGLLAFSRVATRAGPIQVVHAAAALARARNELAATIEATGASITHGPLPRVLADEDQLVTLFRILLENALEFRGAEPPHIHVTARREDGHWRLAVADNGIGVPAAHHETIFDPFERLHHREEHAGAGMGLAVARRILDRHGGRIWLDTEPDSGATFCFTLPDAGEKGD